ncbi:MAG TPA: tetratricopeptide repeat protein [Crocinitomicaceae bacterium]|nr:tetratricopeptide repeat protein [Crocinitomicaceae bacterium]
MKRILIILTLICSTVALGQSSEKYNSEYENFYRAEDLFEKEQYAAARKEFRIFIDGFNRQNDPMYVKARYYEAISALELYNNDAIVLLQDFNKNYPESIFKKDIYFRLGKHFYYKRKYKDALAWFDKLSVQDIEEEDKEEFYFKIGYANFKEKNFDEARSAFHEVKDGTSQYASPALYYYSHIAYQNKQYETALDGFLKLEDDAKFGKVVPYYIAQIYYLQGKYEEVTEYASKISNKGNIVNEKDMDHLIGDAFYRTGKYDEAVPYLERYNKVTETSREENYRLGYAYFKSGSYNKAIRLFDKVKKVKDSLGQVSFYHIGESMLKLDNLVSARSGFEGAAFIDKDPVIQEDALYNYAILSYKLDINPYDEAVEAFEMYLNKYPDSERKEDVYQYLVNVYMTTNNYPKALTSLDKIPNKDIRLKTAYQVIAFNQGVQRFQNSNYPGAISSFNLVKKYPVDPAISGKAVYWIADANYRLNKYNEAIQGYKSFAIMPSVREKEMQTEAHYNVGYAYLKKEELTKSIEAFRIYLQNNPANKHKQADAFMRIADSYFVLKENDLAIKNYQDALALKSGYEDQALFYMAKTYGYKGETQTKITRLLDIVNNYKESKYLQLAVYEIAESYLAEGELTKAMEYYKKIIFDYPSSQLVVESKINVADIYFKQGDYVRAESGYKEVLANNTDTKVCARVVRGLVDIYKASQQTDKVDGLLVQYPCANFSPEEKENLYYLPAIEAYNDSSYQTAITLFDKYLAKFPTGRYNNEVVNYQANCYYKLNDIPKAVELYMISLEGPNTGFTELAASRVSHYLYNEGRYEEVIKYYKKLETISSTPEVIFNAKLGLMRSNFLIENWANAAQYADKVLKNTEINDAIKLEANYAKGMANYYLKSYDAAKVSLVWVLTNTTTIKAAEARFSLADIFYQQEYLPQADEEITALLKQKPTYNYWVAKGLILRTRILIKQDNLFQAEQTLKSVMDHYPIPDDGILDEANQLWSELMQLKDTPKENITPDVDPIIEINGQNGN